MRCRRTRFSGVLTYGIDKDTVNIGASSVTVEQPSTSVSASRSFNPSAVPAGGGKVRVRVDVRNYENIGKVVETLPAGFSYVSGSSALVLDEITEDGSGRQMVPFSLVGETSFTYEVTTSSANGLYTFEGTLTYSIEKSTANVGGPRIRVGPCACAIHWRRRHGWWWRHGWRCRHRWWRYAHHDHPSWLSPNNLRRHTGGVQRAGEYDGCHLSEHCRRENGNLED